MNMQQESMAMNVPQESIAEQQIKKPLIDLVFTISQYVIFGIIQITAVFSIYIKQKETILKHNIHGVNLLEGMIYLCILLSTTILINALKDYLQIFMALKYAWLAFAVFILYKYVKIVIREGAIIFLDEERIYKTLVIILFLVLMYIMINLIFCKKIQFYNNINILFLMIGLGLIILICSFYLKRDIPAIIILTFMLCISIFLQFLNQSYYV